jgi:predicted AAA+ superfamily ATPase
VETGIDQPTLYDQSCDDVFTLAEAVRDRLERESWNNVHELIAQLIELVSNLRTESWLIAGVKRNQAPDPVHVPRPGDKPPEVRTVRPSEFARMMVS